MPSRSLVLPFLAAFAVPALGAVSAPRPINGTVLITKVDHKFECGQVKDPDLAIEGCKALIEENPDDGEAHLALGLAYERIEAGSDALDAFITATSIGHQRIEANDQDGHAWLLIALASRGAARIAKDQPRHAQGF